MSIEPRMHVLTHSTSVNSVISKLIIDQCKALGGGSGLSLSSLKSQYEGVVM
jgi:hypothetical protein